MKPSTIDDLKSEAAHYRALADRIDELIAFAQGKVVNVAALPQSDVVSPRPIQFRRTLKLTKADAAAQALQNAKRPLKKSDLIEEIIKIGVSVDNPDSFSSILSRDPRFAPIGNGEWTLVSSYAKDMDTKNMKDPIL